MLTKISAVSICGGGSGVYAVNIDISDHCIKAVGTISSLDIGGIFRNGVQWKTTKADTLPALEPGGKIRSGDAGLQQQGKGMVKLLPSHFCLEKKGEAKVQQ